MLVYSSPRETLTAVRQARARGQVIGCVPTMGALHPGHSSLIQRARLECDFVVATIFVNPTQFGPNEDFSRYPRTLEADLEICRDSGADLVFTPNVSDMYAANAETLVRVSQLSTILEGAHRPGHFDGVTTVVSKLFLITDPDRAYFGQKDFQQQLIIRRMVRDLNFPIEIVTCPIIRESDGLAMSSRNRYLAPAERETARVLSQALTVAQALATDPQQTPQSIEEKLQERLQGTAGIDLQYAVVVDTETLSALAARPSNGLAVALIAARVGTTRLLDNQLLVFS